ncbi:hypothetical protein GCM10011611_08270 [Aliidongia dinghuensis]|uniref:Uncharacterized protein n=1 Tax=Aliidongia dinghuensis TaxID=1867774 RepID=A0A8J3E1U3_9PROT|nr:hypothetical protein GCM10011611_08270 [Aliidongia dinghuensis]
MAIAATSAQAKPAPLALPTVPAIGPKMMAMPATPLSAPQTRPGDRADPSSTRAMTAANSDEVESTRAASPLGTRRVAS